jgi:hypothetical protein
MDWQGFQEHWDNSFARELGWLGCGSTPVPVADPTLLALDDELARELGLDPDHLRSPRRRRPRRERRRAGSEPIAQGYAGHQFGQLSPLLGDGRAHLLGEVVDARGRRRDIALKGSGRTPFSRGGDGRAVVGPVIREYLVSAFMHAVGGSRRRGRWPRWRPGRRSCASARCRAACSPGWQPRTCASARSCCSRRRARASSWSRPSSTPAPGTTPTWHRATRWRCSRRSSTGRRASSPAGCRSASSTA